MIRLTPEQFAKKYGKESLSLFPENTTQEPLGYVSDAMSDIRQTGRDLTTTAKETFGQGGTVSRALDAGIKGRQGLLRSFAQAFGLGAQGVASGIGDVFKGAVKTAFPQSGEDIAKESLKTVAAPIAKSVMEIPVVKKFVDDYQSLPDDQKRDVDALFGVGNLAFELGTMGVGGRGMQVGKEVVERGAKSAIKAGEDIVSAAKKITPRITEKLLPKEPNLAEATGQILQGKTKDITKGVKALTEVNKTGIKTFSDLKTRITEKITELAKKVDTDLGKDTTKYTLKDLQVVGKTKLGKEITTDYVSTALKQLKELYTTIGDDVKAVDIGDIIARSKTEGLTRLEVNDISRVYGQEFGQKAFSKLGDPLTSVNAQLFENVRRGLKGVARKGIGGKEAQIADKTMTNLYNTERLIDKNIEAVNKLRQKIQERGLLEKTGHIIAKYADILSGGSIRGLIGGLLPRGAGYKVMNALDLEERLIKNLDIIERATKGKTAKEIEDILKTLIP